MTKANFFHRIGLPIRATSGVAAATNIDRRLPSKFFTKIASALALLTVLSCGGCVRVKPFEREAHARKTMQEREASDVKLEGHVHEYREGSIGGGGVGGGGCGCN
jgi:hypothetical protein